MIENKKAKIYWLLTIAILGFALLSLLAKLMFSINTTVVLSNYTILKLFLYILILGSVFFVLCYTYYKKKTFSFCLTTSLLLISILLFLCAILLPMYPQHLQVFPFRIFAHGSNYLIDGWYFIASLIVFLLSRISKHGTCLQEEMDGII